MIHVFHGFLGSPDDFSFLKREGVLIHDLYSMDQFPQINCDDTLIGYSLGGRIALEIASEKKFKFNKLILLNSHPGLTDLEEKIHRAEFETQIINQLKSMPCGDFIEYWNSLPIFFHDRPIHITQERYNKSADLFDRYRLSNQKYYLPEMILHKNKILYLVGLFDEKYMDLANEVLIPAEISVKGIPGGHRLFQQSDFLMQVLKSEGVL